MSTEHLKMFIHEIWEYWRHRDWTILLTTGGRSGCIARTDNGLFYLPLERSLGVLPAENGLLFTTEEKSGCIAGTENGLLYLPLEGSLDVLTAQRMDYSTYHWREVWMYCRHR